MNKNLLAVVGLALIGSTAIAQQPATRKVNELDRIKQKNTSVIDAAQTIPVMRQHPENTGARAAVDQILIGSSYNIFTALVSESRALTYNEDLNAMMFTHRENADLPGGSGVIQTTFSRDGGLTWVADDYNLLTDAAYLARYPSGVFYNPVGNTELDSAYSVVFGPITSGDGWDGNYFNSMQVGGDFQDEYYAINDTIGVFPQHFARINATSTKDGLIRIMADSMDVDADPLLDHNSVMNVGTFNEASHSFDWSQQMFDTDFAIDPTDGSMQFARTAYQAWNSEGTVGYVIQTGVEASSTGNDRAWLPIIYKTVDSGTTWVLEDRMDWTTLTEVTSRLSTNGSVTRPFFTAGNGFGLTVDMNDDLHIACEIITQFSDDDDSLAWANSPIAPNPTFLYDVHMENGGWDAFVIDSIFVDAYTNPNLADQIIDARLQVNRNEDGSKLFYAWMSSNVDFTTVNEIPDLFAKGYDVSNGYETEAVNFTIGTDFEGYNFYMYLSDISISDNGTYTVPMTMSLPTGSELDPMNHYYVSGIEFTDGDFVGDVSVQDLPAALSSMNVYPNPATNVINIELNAIVNSNVELSLVNIVGQTVSSKSISIVSGLNKTSLNIDGLSSGVYFIKTSVNNQTTTSKIIVE